MRTQAPSIFGRGHEHGHGHEHGNPNPKDPFSVSVSPTPPSISIYSSSPLSSPLDTSFSAPTSPDTLSPISPSSLSSSPSLSLTSPVSPTNTGSTIHGHGHGHGQGHGGTVGRGIAIPIPHAHTLDLPSSAGPGYMAQHHHQQQHHNQHQHSHGFRPPWQGAFSLCLPHIEKSKTKTLTSCHANLISFRSYYITSGRAAYISISYVCYGSPNSGNAMAMLVDIHTQRTLGPFSRFHSLFPSSSSLPPSGESSRMTVAQGPPPKALKTRIITWNMHESLPKVRVLSFFHFFSSRRRTDDVSIFIVWWRGSVGHAYV